MASFPVVCLRSSIAAFALSSFLVAMYTFAFLANSAYAHHMRDEGAVDTFFNLDPGDRLIALNTLVVSLPIPALPPVTMTTFPVKSGMSSVANLDFGAK